MNNLVYGRYELVKVYLTHFDEEYLKYFVVWRNGSGKLHFGYMNSKGKDGDGNRMLQEWSLNDVG